MGRVYKPKYAYTRKDGTRVEKVTEAWYIEYGDASGRWVRRKAGLTKQQAQDALRKAEGEVLAEKNNIPTRSFADIPLHELLDSYVRAQRPNWNPDHAILRERQLRWVFATTRSHLVRDLTPEKMDMVLALLEEKGLAVRTINLYLVAAKAFFNWAVRRRLVPYNPLACIAARRGLPRNPRRPLTVEEGRRLLEVALDGPRRRMVRAYRGRFQNRSSPVSLPSNLAARLGREGRSYALAYRICMTCGLRKSELRALIWADLDLDRATLVVRNDKGDKLTGRSSAQELPMPPETVEALRTWRKETQPQPTDRVVPVRELLSETLNDDLEAAGIPKRDALGRVVDVHALRHTCGTWLNNAGADPKTIQTIMRHKDIQTTYGIYVHADRNRLFAAAQAMPSLSPQQAPVTNQGAAAFFQAVASA